MPINPALSLSACLRRVASKYAPPSPLFCYRALILTLYDARCRARDRAVVSTGFDVACAALAGVKTAELVTATPAALAAPRRAAHIPCLDTGDAVAAES